VFGKYRKPSTFVLPKQKNTDKIFFMNKGDLIDKVANDAKLTKTQASAAIDAFLHASMQALKKGDKVTLVGFGTFSVVTRNARKGLNPKTLKPLTIPKRKVVKFKVGKELSNKVK
jgi:DNA-binding protein HU-beta